jgi:hypothetical protein
MDRDEMLRIKKYLESINSLNVTAKEELVKEWAAVYNIVYKALNGVEIPSKAR